MASDGRRQRKGEGTVTRDAILAAARELFLTLGYTQTTVRGIVARVGVTPPVLYRYFRDKDDILFEVADDAFRKLETAFRAALAEAPESLDALRRMMEAYVRFGLTHPDEYRFVFMSRELVPPSVTHRPSPDVAAPKGQRGATCFRLLEDLVARLTAAGHLRPGDPSLHAELIWAAGHGLVALLISHPNFPWREREDLIRGMVDLPLEGLLPRNDPA